MIVCRPFVLKVALLSQTSRVNADDVRPVLWIVWRGHTLPRFTFLEWLVAMQTTFGTLAARSCHVLNRRVLVLTKDSIVLGARLVLGHGHFSIE